MFKSRKLVNLKSLKSKLHYIRIILLSITLLYIYIYIYDLSKSITRIKQDTLAFLCSTILLTSIFSNPLRR